MVPLGCCRNIGSGATVPAPVPLPKAVPVPVPDEEEEAELELLELGALEGLELGTEREWIGWIGNIAIGVVDVFLSSWFIERVRFEFIFEWTLECGLGLEVEGGLLLFDSVQFGLEFGAPTALPLGKGWGGCWG